MGETKRPHRKPADSEEALARAALESGEGPPPAAGELDGDAFARLQNQAELDDHAMAMLFDVDAAAMEHWRRHGVPQVHIELLRRLRELVRRLDSHGRERSIGEELRTPVPAVGGATLLQALQSKDGEFLAATEAALSEGVSKASMRRPFRIEEESVDNPDIVEHVMTRLPVTVDATDSLVDAARHLRNADIGAVFVTERGGLAGVLSDRDIVVRGIATNRNPRTTKVAAVCSRDVVSVSSAASLDDARQLMVKHSVRRLPVVSNGVLVGAVSLGDLAVEGEPESELASLVGSRQSP
ncbi:MAG: CBS domain-containing protein [Candidatus Dormibacteria bacterium]